MSFEYSVEFLHSLVDPKSPEQLAKIGGVEGLLKGLKSNATTGLSSNAGSIGINISESKPAIATENSNAHQERIAFFGSNTLPPPKKKSFFDFCLEAVKDKILIILAIAAVVEMGIAVYKYVDGRQIAGFIDGGAIIIAILVVVLVTAANDFNKQKQFRKLNDFSKGLATTKVIRDGVNAHIKNSELLVGDIVLIETGDVFPADGVLIESHQLRCDESSLTGESDAITKHVTKEPYLLSGTKVVVGVGKMVVIATGSNSINGRLMAELNSESEETPLQKKLSALADSIAKLGIGSAVLMIVLVLITYFSVQVEGGRTSYRIGKDMISIFISAVTVIVVAVPEGLPLAVTLALAHATVQMLKDNNLVRHLSACETMGNATTICSDKTGTLTQNKMTVVRGRTFKESFELADISEVNVLKSVTNAQNRTYLIDLFAKAININSSAEENENSAGLVEFNGSKTEVALLEYTRKLGREYKKDRTSTKVVELFPFSSESKRMSSIVDPIPNLDQIFPDLAGRQGEYILFSKGASEIILGCCDSFANENANIIPFTQESKAETIKLIESFAKAALRTIAVAFKPLGAYTPPPPSTDDDDDSKPLRPDPSTDNMVLLAIVGIEDPVRPEVPAAVKSCQNAGVIVRMVTGDNPITAKSIAIQCGILTEGGLVMEGPVFRKLSQSEMDRVVPNLQVLARSSPIDKQVLVNCLKRLGETVAVTGDGTNDAPALKSADVGFAMGIAGTAVAKEACDIVLIDDNFASLVKAVIWGRCVFDAVRKFLQFQLTVNVTAVVITIVTALISTVTTPKKIPYAVLSAVQLLWVNMIMDTFAALALATDVPTDALLNRKPTKKNAPLISVDMWKQIIGQAIYQMIICFWMYLSPQSIFDIPVDQIGVFDEDTGTNSFTSTIVFNIFVLCQLFNELNCRSITREINVFAGILKNYYFIPIILGSLIVQFIIVQYAGPVFHTIPLSPLSWLLCIILGFGSVPIGLIIRLIPVTDPTDEQAALTEQMEMAEEAHDLENVVIESVEKQTGVSLTKAEREMWRRAIRRTTTQLRVVGAFRESKESFNEGVRVGALVAMSLKSVESDMAGEDVASELGVPGGGVKKDGEDYWGVARLKVRRQVGVIEAFRKHRRDNTFLD